MNKLRQPITHKTLLAAEVYDDLIHEIVMIRKAVLKDRKTPVNIIATAEYYWPQSDSFMPVFGYRTSTQDAWPSK